MDQNKIYPRSNDNQTVYLKSVVTRPTIEVGDLTIYNDFVIRLERYTTSPSLNLPVIPTFRDIANLIECVAMFYFIKGLSVFRIVTEPCADRFPLLCGLAVALHHALDVGGFGGRED